MKLILASASPRRREILELIGLAPDAIIPSDADETTPEGLSPAEQVRLLARRKGESILPKTGEDDLILASDTLVACDGVVLGKPHDRGDAFRMLRMLSGRTHEVCTGVCLLYRGKTDVFVNRTQVEFYPLTDGEINAYLDTGEPFDKAGAYGIQGRGAVLVKGIRGDFFSVMGLPAAEVARRVREMTADD